MHDIISRKKGSLQVEDDEYVVVRNVFKEIPVFKDIPNNFKLELANELEALTFNTHDLILDQRENQHFYILLQGEALIIQSDKQLQILQKTQFSNAQATPRVVEAASDTLDDDPLDLTQVRIRKNTIVAPRDLASIPRTQHWSKEHTAPFSRAGEMIPKDTASPGDNNEEPTWMKNEDVKVIQICDCFGQYYSLTGQRWRPSFVMAIKDHTLVLRANVVKIDTMLNKINSSEQHKQLLTFLGSTISGFDRISAAARDKIARCFVEKQYYPGQKLIREGEPHTTAYIIKEGDCVFMSRQNPTDIKFTEDGKPVVKVHRGLDNLNQDKKKRGYMSKTTNTFQFGVKGKGQWVGEDILVLGNNDPFYFSVVAIGRVQVLEISKSDMLSKLPHQCIKFLEKSALKRKEWVLQRMQNINKTVKQVIKQGEEKVDDEGDHYRSNQMQQSRNKIDLKAHSESRVQRSINQKTILMKIKGDLSIDETGLEVKLPQLVNPRDAQMLKSLSRKSLNNQNYEGDDTYEVTSANPHNQSKNTQSQSPLRVNKSMRVNNMKDLQKQMLSQLNNRIDQKHVQQYCDESNRQFDGSKSELGMVRMSFNTSHFGDSVYQGHNKNSQSFANISQSGLSEINEMSNATTTQTNRKIPLLNAQTLKPFLVNRRRTELIPVFHQRNPQKTRNAIANSVHAMKYENQLSYSMLDQPYGFESTDNLNKSFNDIDSVQHLNNSQHKFQSDQQNDCYQQYSTSKTSIKPSLYQFNTSSQSSTRSPNIKVKGKLSGLAKIDSKLQKEAKQKYQSFMLGNFRQVNELDKSVIQQVTLSHMKTDEGSDYKSTNPYMVENREADSTIDEHSRKNTPNPWEQYKRRLMRKSRLSQGLSKMSNYQTEQNIKTALSYLNYDI